MNTKTVKDLRVVMKRMRQVLVLLVFFNTFTYGLTNSFGLAPGSTSPVHLQPGGSSNIQLSFNFDADPTSFEGIIDNTISLDVSSASISSNIVVFGLQSSALGASSFGIHLVKFKLSTVNRTKTLEVVVNIAYEEPIVNIEVSSALYHVYGRPSSFSVTFTGGSNINTEWFINGISSFSLMKNGNGTRSFVESRILSQTGKVTVKVEASNPVSNVTHSIDIYIYYTIRDFSVTTKPSTVSEEAEILLSVSSTAEQPQGNISIRIDFGNGNTSTADLASNDSLLSGPGFVFRNWYRTEGNYTVIVHLKSPIDSQNITKVIQIQNPILGLKVSSDTYHTYGSNSKIQVYLGEGTNVELKLSFNNVLAITSFQPGNGSRTIVFDHTFTDTDNINITVSASNLISTATDSTTVYNYYKLNGLYLESKGFTKFENATIFLKQTSSASVPMGQVNISLDFGDGSDSLSDQDLDNAVLATTGVNFSHHYTSEGNFSVTANVTSPIDSIILHLDMQIQEVISGVEVSCDAYHAVGDQALINIKVTDGTNVQIELFVNGKSTSFTFLPGHGTRDLLINQTFVDTNEIEIKARASNLVSNLENTTNVYNYYKINGFYLTCNVFTKFESAKIYLKRNTNASMPMGALTIIIQFGDGNSSMVNDSSENPFFTTTGVEFQHQYAMEANYSITVNLTSPVDSIILTKDIQIIEAISGILVSCELYQAVGGQALINITLIDGTNVYTELFLNEKSTSVMFHPGDGYRTFLSNQTILDPNTVEIKVNASNPVSTITNTTTVYTYYKLNGFYLTCDAFTKFENAKIYLKRDVNASMPMGALTINMNFGDGNASLINVHSDNFTLINPGLEFKHQYLTEANFSITVNVTSLVDSIILTKEIQIMKAISKVLVTCDIYHVVGDQAILNVTIIDGTNVVTELTLNGKSALVMFHPGDGTRAFSTNQTLVDPNKVDVVVRASNPVSKVTNSTTVYTFYKLSGFYLTCDAFTKFENAKIYLKRISNSVLPMGTIDINMDFGDGNNTSVKENSSNPILTSNGVEFGHQYAEEGNFSLNVTLISPVDTITLGKDIQIMNAISEVLISCETYHHLVGDQTIVNITLIGGTNVHTELFLNEKSTLLLFHPGDGIRTFVSNQTLVDPNKVEIKVIASNPVSTITNTTTVYTYYKLNGFYLTFDAFTKFENAKIYLKRKVNANKPMGAIDINMDFGDSYNSVVKDNSNNPALTINGVEFLHQYSAEANYTITVNISSPVDSITIIKEIQIMKAISEVLVSCETYHIVGEQAVINITLINGTNVHTELFINGKSSAVMFHPGEGIRTFLSQQSLVDTNKVELKVVASNPVSTINNKTTVYTYYKLNGFYLTCGAFTRFENAKIYLKRNINAKIPMGSIDINMDFGDGDDSSIKDNSNNPALTSNGVEFLHQYSTEANYTITVNISSPVDSIILKKEILIMVPISRILVSCETYHIVGNQALINMKLIDGTNVHTALFLNGKSKFLKFHPGDGTREFASNQTLLNTNQIEIKVTASNPVSSVINTTTVYSYFKINGLYLTCKTFAKLENAKIYLKRYGNATLPMGALTIIMEFGDGSDLAANKNFDHPASESTGVEFTHQYSTDANFSITVNVTSPVDSIILRKEIQIMEAISRILVSCDTYHVVGDEALINVTLIEGTNINTEVFINNITTHVMVHAGNGTRQFFVNHTFSDTDAIEIKVVASNLVSTMSNSTTVYNYYKLKGFYLSVEPYTKFENATVYLKLNNSSSMGPLNISVDYGDGTHSFITENSNNPELLSNGIRFHHQYPTEGNYTAVINLTSPVDSVMLLLDVQILEPIYDIMFQTKEFHTVGEILKMYGYLTGGYNVQTMWHIGTSQFPTLYLDGTGNRSFILEQNITETGRIDINVTAVNVVSEKSFVSTVYYYYPVSGFSMHHDITSTLWDAELNFRLNQTAMLPQGPIHIELYFGDGKMTSLHVNSTDPTLMNPGLLFSHRYSKWGNYTVFTNLTSPVGSGNVTSTLTVLEPISGIEFQCREYLEVGDELLISATIYGGYDAQTVWHFTDSPSLTVDHPGNGTRQFIVKTNITGSGPKNISVVATNLVSNSTNETTIYYVYSISNFSLAHSIVSIDDVADINISLPSNAIQPQGPIKLYLQFGDGNTTSKEFLSTDPVLTSTGFVFSHRYSATGNYTLNLTLISPIYVHHIISTIQIIEPIYGIQLHCKEYWAVGDELVLDVYVDHGHDVETAFRIGNASPVVVNLHDNGTRWFKFIRSVSETDRIYISVDASNPVSNTTNSTVIFYYFKINGFTLSNDEALSIFDEAKFLLKLDPSANQPMGTLEIEFMYGDGNTTKFTVESQNETLINPGFLFPYRYTMFDDYTAVARIVSRVNEVNYTSLIQMLEPIVGIQFTCNLYNLIGVPIRITAYLYDGTKVDTTWKFGVNTYETLSVSGSGYRNFTFQKNVQEAGYLNVSVSANNAVSSSFNYTSIHNFYGINGFYIEHSETFQTTENAIIYLKINSNANQPQGLIDIELSFGDGNNTMNYNISSEDLIFQGSGLIYHHRYHIQGVYNISARIISYVDTRTYSSNIKIWDQLSVTLSSKKYVRVDEVIWFDFLSVPNSNFMYHIEYGDGENKTNPESDLYRRYDFTNWTKSYSAPALYTVQCHVWNPEHSTYFTYDIRVEYPLPDADMTLLPVYDTIPLPDGNIEYTLLITINIPDPSNVVCDFDFGENEMTFRNNSIYIGFNTNHTKKYQFKTNGGKNVTFWCRNSVSSRAITAFTNVLRYTLADLKVIYMNPVSMNMTLERFYPTNPRTHPYRAVDVPVNVTFVLDLLGCSRLPTGIFITWNFGDNTNEETTNSTGLFHRHEFSKRDTFYISVFILDSNKNETDSRTYPITTRTVTLSTDKLKVDLRHENFTLTATTLPGEDVTYTFYPDSHQLTLFSQLTHYNNVTNMTTSWASIMYKEYGKYIPKVVGSNGTVTEQVYLDVILIADYNLKGELILDIIPETVALPPGNVQFKISVASGEPHRPYVSCNISAGDQVDRSYYNNTHNITHESPMIFPFTYITLGSQMVHVWCKNYISNETWAKKVDVLNPCFDHRGIFDRQYSMPTYPMAVNTKTDLYISSRMGSVCKNPYFIWQIYKADNSGKLDNTEIQYDNPMIPSTGTLLLVRGTLLPGLYYLSLRVEPVSTYIYEYMYLKFSESPPYAYISGGHKLTTRPTEYVDIDALQLSHWSAGQFGETEHLQFTWQCLRIHSKSSFDVASILTNEAKTVSAGTASSNSATQPPSANFNSTTGISNAASVSSESTLNTDYPTHMTSSNSNSTTGLSNAASNSSESTMNVNYTTHTTLGYSESTLQSNSYLSTDSPSTDNSNEPSTSQSGTPGTISNIVLGNCNLTSVSHGLVRLVLDGETGDFLVKVTVSEDDKESNFTQIITVVENEESPVLVLNCSVNCARKVAVTSKIAYVSWCKTCIAENRSLVYDWQLWQFDKTEDRYINITANTSTGTTDQAYALLKDSLMAGEYYMITLNVSYGNGTEYGVADVFTTFKTNFPPYGGSCNFTVDEDMLLTVKCTGWADEEEYPDQVYTRDLPRNVPLLYQYETHTERKLSQGTETVISIIYRGSESSILGEPIQAGDENFGYKVKVVVRIYDTYGDYSEDSETLTVSPPSNTQPSNKDDVSTISSMITNFQSNYEKKRNGGNDMAAIRLIGSIASLFKSFPNGDRTTTEHEIMSGAVTKVTIDTTDDPAVAEYKMQVDQLLSLLMNDIQTNCNSYSKRFSVADVQLICSAVDAITRIDQYISFTMVENTTKLMNELVKCFESTTDKAPLPVSYVDAINETATTIHRIINSLLNIMLPDQLQDFNTENSYASIYAILVRDNERLKSQEALLKMVNVSSLIDYGVLSLKANMLYEVREHVRQIQKQQIDLARMYFPVMQRVLRVTQNVILKTLVLNERHILSRSMVDIVTEKVTVDSIKNRTDKYFIGIQPSNGTFDQLTDIVFAMKINYFKKNPYIYGENASSLTSGVSTFDIGDDIKLDVKLPNNGQFEYQKFIPLINPNYPEKMIYFTFDVVNNDDAAIIFINPDGFDINNPQNFTLYTFYISSVDFPTSIDYEFIKTIGIRDWSGIGFKVFLRQGLCTKGTCYLGIKPLDVPDFSSLSRRRKRSVVTTTLPPSTTSSNDTLTVNQNEFVPIEANFSLQVITTGCRSWNDSEFAWSAVGCQVLPMSDVNETVCRCTGHVFSTTFYVPPNMINFLEVWSKFDATNAFVYGPLIGLIVIYIIAAILLRREDKKDLKKWATHFLIDHDSAEEYFYLITVQTGMRRGAGTKSNVNFVITGNDCDTGIRVLADGVKEGFEMSSINKYFMGTHCQLGELKYLRIWHDNSGKNGAQGWYLSRVVVDDLQTKDRYIFLCDKWLAVDEDDGMIDRILPVSSKANLEAFKTLLSENTNSNLTEHHLWVSLLLRPNISRFTRVQRLSCLLALLFLVMISNAMFFKSSTEETTFSEIRLGFMRLSVSTLYISFIGVVITTPPILFVIFVFRKSKAKKIKKKEINTSKENSKENSKKYDGTEKTLDIDTINEMYMFDGDSYPLPHWTVYIAWIVIFLAVLTSAFFLVLYSMEWGKSKSEEWLTSFLFSFIESCLFVDPLKVIIVSFLFATIFKNVTEGGPPSIDVEKLKLAGSNYEGDTRHSFIALMNDILRKNEPPSEEDLTLIRKKRQEEKKAKDAVFNIIVYLIYIFAVYSISYLERDLRSFRYKSNIDNYLISHGYGQLGFSGINDTRDFISWLNQTFIPTYYPLHNYNGANLIVPDKEWFGDLFSIRVGPARLRLLRNTEELCSKWDITWPRACVDRYYFTDEDQSHYCVGWLPYNHSVCGSDIYIKSFFTSEAWKYTNAEDIWGVLRTGEYNTYSGGGYILRFTRDRTNAVAMLNELVRKQWINRNTRAVFLEFTLYNPYSNLFAYATFLVEVTELGGILTWTETQAFRPVITMDSTGTFAVICYILFIIYIFGQFIKKIVDIKTIGYCKFMKIPWNIVDCITIFLGFSCIAVYVVRMNFTNKAMQLFYDDKLANTNQFINFAHILIWDNIFNALFAFLVFISTLKILKILGYNKRFTQIISVVSGAGPEIAGFGVVFFIVYFAFVLFGTLVFGVQLREYKNVFSTLGSLSNTFIGKNSLDSLVRAAPTTARVYFFVYMVAVILTLLTMFAAILNKSISEVKEEASKYADTVGILDVCKKSVKNFIGMFFKLSSRDKSSNNGKMKDLANIKRDGFEASNILRLVRETMSAYEDTKVNDEVDHQAKPLSRSPSLMPPVSRQDVILEETLDDSHEIAYNRNKRVSLQSTVLKGSVYGNSGESYQDNSRNSRLDVVLKESLYGNGMVNREEDDVGDIHIGEDKDMRLL